MRWPASFQRLNGSVRGVPGTDEQMVDERMRSLLRFGTGPRDIRTSSNHGLRMIGR